MNVWRVPLAGGKPEQVLDRPSRLPVISPDGRLLACFYQEAEGSDGIAVLPIDGGAPVLMIQGAEHLPESRCEWSGDGKSLLFLRRESGRTNILAKPLEGGPSRAVTRFQSGEIFWFKPTTDGRSLVLARGSANSDIVLINDVQ